MVFSHNFKNIKYKYYLCFYLSFIFLWGCAYHPDYPKLSEIQPAESATPIDGIWHVSSGKGYCISNGRVYAADIERIDNNSTTAKYNYLHVIGWNIRQIDTGVYNMEWLSSDSIKEVSGVGMADIKIIDSNHIMLHIKENPAIGIKEHEVKLYSNNSITRPDLYQRELNIIRPNQAETAWNQAKETNTIESYNHFLLSHSDSKHIEEAQRRSHILTIKKNKQDARLDIIKYNHSKQLGKKDIETLLRKIKYELSPFTIENLLSGHYNQNNPILSAGDGVDIQRLKKERIENGKKVSISISMAAIDGQTTQILVSKQDGDISFSDFTEGNAGTKTILIYKPISHDTKSLNNFRCVEIFSPDALKGEYLNNGSGIWRKSVQAPIPTTGPSTLVSTYLSSAWTLDPEATSVFLSETYKDDLIAEFQAQRKLGWNYSAEKTYIKEEKIDDNEYEASVKAFVTYEGGESIIGVEMTFFLELENWAWKISGRDHAAQQAGGLHLKPLSQ